MSRIYADRTHAGRALAARLATLSLPAPRLVLALPRGGVPVAAEVARALHAPLDLLLVRKIGLPAFGELAVAAVAEGTPPDVVIDHALARAYGITPAYIEQRAAEEVQEIARRRRLYLGGRPQQRVAGATVIVVDDGIATGTSVRAALQALRRRRPQRLVLAVPVAPPDTVARLRGEVDELVCLAQPDAFQAVGEVYRDFHQLDDQEVVDILRSVAPPAQEPPCETP